MVEVVQSPGGLLIKGVTNLIRVAPGPPVAPEVLRKIANPVAHLDPFAVRTNAESAATLIVREAPLASQQAINLGRWQAVRHEHVLDLVHVREAQQTLAAIVVRQATVEWRGTQGDQVRTLDEIDQETPGVVKTVPVLQASTKTLTPQT
jgi:hypothetical protein